MELQVFITIRNCDGQRLIIHQSWIPRLLRRMEYATVFNSKASTNEWTCRVNQQNDHKHIEKETRKSEGMTGRWITQGIMVIQNNHKDINK